MKKYKNFDLTNYNSYRIKARCTTAYFPETELEISLLFQELEQYYLIGSGHNIILSKSYYDTPFIILNGNLNSIELINTHIIAASAGSMMWDLSNFALENSLSGLEIFNDIPSSVGGAVVMNAGASGEEIKDILLNVRYLDLEDCKIKEISKNEINFEYRNSIFQKYRNKIVLKAWLELKTGNKKDIKNKMDFIKSQRWIKQPRDFPNAGSVFKRPKGFYVGTIMEHLNLKGLKIGGAMLSNKHGGFIINYNNATGKDILELISFLKRVVKEHYNIELELEQQII